MKLLQVALFLFGFTAPIAAGGERSAAEQAAGYLAYLQEEIFTDSSKWKIASGCEGSRTGIRNQKKRCTLGEFLLHLWKADPEFPDITKPAADRVRWPDNMLRDSTVVEQNGRWVPQNLLPEDMKNWIWNNVRYYDAPANVPNRFDERIAPPGFYGVYDSQKLVGVDYFHSQAQVGYASKAAADEYSSVSKSLGDKERAFFDETKKQVLRAANICYYLRVKDKWDALWDPRKGDLERKLNLGVDIAKKPVSAPDDIANAVRPAWQEIHAAKTITNIQNAKKISYDAARTIYTTAWKKITSGDMFSAHESAIKGTDHLRKNIGCK